MPEGPITHFSYSQLNTYLSCPLKYRLQYVELIPPAFTSVALAFGSALHEAVGAYYQSRLEGEALKPDQMHDVYRATWQDAENIKYFNGDNEKTLLQKAKQLIDVFHENVSPDTLVLGVEEFFEFNIEGVPPFQGYIDLIEQSPDGMITVADLKTAAKKLGDNNVHSNLQLTAYSLGAEALGFDPDSLTMRLDVLTKTKSPEMVRYETTRTHLERDRFVKLVKQVWSAIERHAFFPRDDWHCAQCAWADHCREW
ncbi:RecB family exonuclease [Desulfomonile tiedjei]|uniref:RecB family exonuclease n=1 Tax=Desulfomonile tiedjei (strain ATCC 49306 / DSM 6799 / DCB-1) TaxID=706587 RepID=I4C5N3_DESTA|nr:PD-(D/E)XK nuclease family protein [Desulfomonile tiedjei]AFM24874.1 RecB family exonuclease [Desulfomonile tiedjei DSM 6799]